MRRVLFALALFSLAAAAPPAPDVQFVRVWPEYHPAIDFKRISEYFSGQENTSHQIIERTQPSSRAGYYFLVRVKHPKAALAKAKFVLRIITPDDPLPKVYTFPAACPPGIHVFNLGLTGKDWSRHSVHPVAWRLELLAGDGQTLAAQQSYLWSKPGT